MSHVRWAPPVKGNDPEEDAHMRELHNAFVAGYILRCEDLVEDIQESTNFVELKRKNDETIRSARRSYV